MNARLPRLYSSRMKSNDSTTPAQPQYVDAPDASRDVRLFASWMGLAVVAFGVAMAGYLFFRIGQVVLDPRSFETQVDRWEFVIRGRTSDAFPEAYETPDRQLIQTPRTPEDDTAGANPENAAPGGTSDQVEEMARFMGRVGSKSARPAALLLIILVLMLLVRIIVAIIHAGIRLAGLSGGEREYMKRVIDELVYQRGRRGD